MALDTHHQLSSDLLASLKVIPEDVFDISSDKKFVRTNPRAFNSTEPLASQRHVGEYVECGGEVHSCTSLKLVEELGEYHSPVTWLIEAVKLGIDWFAHSGSHRISSNPLYKNGYVYGMDISSASAIHALDPEPGEHILELCCAPCMKMTYIHDVQYAKFRSPTHLENSALNFKIKFKPQISFSDRKKLGTVTGVDLSNKRINVGNSILKKYQIVNYRLYLDDATTFNQAPPGSPQLKEKRPIYIPKIMKSLYPEDSNSHSTTYDRILVDAECTHDGSITHLEKRSQRTEWDDDFKGFVNPSMVNDGKSIDKTTKHVHLDTSLLELETLQRRLIHNGFKQLKPGGVLVYSTCSFSWRQNEAIVCWLLNTVGDKLTLDDLPKSHVTWPRAMRFLQKLKSDASSDEVTAKSWDVSYEMNNERKVIDINQLISVAEKTIRFTPLESKTSGFFVARLTKKA